MELDDGVPALRMMIQAKIPIYWSFLSSSALSTGTAPRGPEASNTDLGSAARDCRRRRKRNSRDKE